MALPEAHADHVPRPATRAFARAAEPTKPAVKGSKITEPPRRSTATPTAANRQPPSPAHRQIGLLCSTARNGATPPPVKWRGEGRAVSTNPRVAPTAHCAPRARAAGPGQVGLGPSLLPAMPAPGSDRARSGSPLLSAHGGTTTCPTSTPAAKTGFRQAGRFMRVSPATSMGPPFGVFCHEHGTTRLPVMGPPGASAWRS